MLPTPPHVPWLALSVAVRCAVPVSAGAAVFTGGALVTVWLATLATLADPSALVAATSTRSCAPSSATPRV